MPAIPPRSRSAASSGGGGRRHQPRQTKQLQGCHPRDHWPSVMAPSLCFQLSATLLVGTAPNCRVRARQHRTRWREGGGAVRVCRAQRGLLEPGLCVAAGASLISRLQWCRDARLFLVWRVGPACRRTDTSTSAGGAAPRCDLGAVRDQPALDSPCGSTHVCDTTSQPLQSRDQSLLQRQQRCGTRHAARSRRLGEGAETASSTPDVGRPVFRPLGAPRHALARAPPLSHAGRAGATQWGNAYFGCVGRRRLCVGGPNTVFRAAAPSACRRRPLRSRLFLRWRHVHVGSRRWRTHPSCEQCCCCWQRWLSAHKGAAGSSGVPAAAPLERAHLPQRGMIRAGAVPAARAAALQS